MMNRFYVGLVTVWLVLFICGVLIYGRPTLNGVVAPSLFGLFASKYILDRLASGIGKLLFARVSRDTPFVVRIFCDFTAVAGSIGAVLRLFGVI
jgi:hypothetical protein